MKNKNIEAFIKEVSYHFIGKRSTVCCLILNSGYEIIGSYSSPTVDYEKTFEWEESVKKAYFNAFQKLTQLYEYTYYCDTKKQEDNIYFNSIKDLMNK